MHRSSRHISLYLPLLVWWSAPPTSEVCPTGGPAIPATAHSSLWMALAGNLAYPSRLWLSPRNAPTLALGWVEGLGCLPPPLVQLSAPGVLPGASRQTMSPPQARERLCVSLAYASLETNHASPEIYPEGGCSSGGISISHHPLLCLAFQYSVPACGPLPISADAPPWLPGGPYHVSGPSLKYESGVQFGG